MFLWLCIGWKQPVWKGWVKPFLTTYAAHSYRLSNVPVWVWRWWRVASAASFLSWSAWPAISLLARLDVIMNRASLQWMVRPCPSVRWPCSWNITYIYTHMHTHTHTHTRTHTHTCTHAHTHMHTRTHAHTHTRTDTCMHTHHIWNCMAWSAILRCRHVWCKCFPMCIHQSV